MSNRWRVEIRDGVAIPRYTERGRVVATFEVDESWELRAGKAPHLECVGPIGQAVAVDVVARLEHAPGWAVRARFEPRGGDLVMTQHEEREMPTEATYSIDDGSLLPAEEHATPLSQRLIRQIGLGGVGRQVTALLVDPVVRERFLGPSWERPRVRVGRSQMDPYASAQWANRYVWALTVDARSPIKTIVAADASHGVVRTEKQVRAQVNRSRDRGLLTRSTVDGSRGRTGKAGGELTDRARALLVELGISEGADHIVTDPMKET